MTAGGARLRTSLAVLILSACSSGSERPPPLVESIGAGGGDTADSSVRSGGRSRDASAGEQSGGGVDGGSDTDGQVGTGGRSNTGGQSNTGGTFPATGGANGTGGGTQSGGQGGAGGTPPEQCRAGVLTGDATAIDQLDVWLLQGYTRITGNLYIGTRPGGLVNDATSLYALECLETVGGEITIVDIPLLTSLSGLENLKSALSLKITNMPELTTLADLTALTLTNTLLVEGNAALTTLGSGIVAAPNIVIDGNDSLTQCEIDRFSATMSSSACACTGIAGPCP